MRVFGNDKSGLRHPPLFRSREKRIRASDSDQDLSGKSPCRFLIDLRGANQHREAPAESFANLHRVNWSTHLVPSCPVLALATISSHVRAQSSSKRIPPLLHK
ncbi:hypothetical protein ATW55_13350 [Ferroacidibacillus organovorans]|uniref:Uncharacterized protein n=1 Tax=Ferroacidibacillus organovorans TaxID=1765683 RepID=A0A117SXB1_9BACL|nr:hypothetical protein ATW55_13350 [Ferroacidibacillus organovorans]